MTRRVVLHVGSPKSGTTYLQAVLERNREALADDGVLVVGASQVERIHAAFVIREDPRLETLPARAAGAWDRLVAEIRAWTGHTAVLSYELLSAAGADQAARALAALDGLEVHVVVTARDFAAVVPSAWQERLKFALTTPLEEWTPKPESARRAEWGWRTLDPAGVAERWGATLPPEQVHVVTNPGRGADRAELWRRFARACGVTTPDLDLDVGGDNQSLGAAAAAVLRRVNLEVGPPLDTNREQARWLRDTLAHQVLAPLDDEPIGLTEDQLRTARELAGRSIERIRRGGYDVVGDLDDLTATPRHARTPGQVGPEEQLDVAVRAIVALVLRLRELDEPPPAAEEQPGPVGAAKHLLARAVARPVRAEVEDAQARLDRIEAALVEGRRLHQRVAMLTDVVTQLLLPAAEQEVPEVTWEALEAYREESL